MSNNSQISPWAVGLAVVAFLLAIAGLWYRFLGPGSAQPPPTRVEAPDYGGMSPRARAYMQNEGR